jgi:uncharacterized membrane protein
MLRMRFGVAGDLALGALGGVLGGTVMRYGGLISAGASLQHVGVALGGAVVLLLAAHGLAQARPVPRRPTPGDGDGGIDRAALLHQALVAGLSDVERNVLGKFLNRQTVVRDVEREHHEARGFGDRATDRIAAFGGSWAFLGLFCAVLVTWMLFNVDTERPFDPFPFILLNLGLSCLAAVQAPIILMSQNRQAHKDRLNAAADYEVNMKAEMEILALHQKLDELREKAWRDLLELQQKQIEMLRRLEGTAAR